jgi:hypothetical protein
MERKFRSDRKPRRSCVICGKPVGKPHNQTCSRQCTGRFVVARRAYEHRECPVCHRMFTAKPALMRRGRVYCSKTCCDQAKHKVHAFVCVKCGEQKTEADFYRDNIHARGHVSRCKECYAEKVREITVLKPYRREQSIKGGAKARGLPYELTREQFMDLWQRPCFYCGDRVPSIGLDRIDSAKGYVPGNVVPCCATCNRMKSNMDFSEFLYHCAKITARSMNGHTFRKDAMAVLPAREERCNQAIQ